MSDFTSSSGKRIHTPSRYRALIREAKKGGKGRRIGILIREAKKLDDPYYASLALLILSSDPRLGLDVACSSAEHAFVNAGRVKRGWRKAELIIELTKRLSHWRDACSDNTVEDVKEYLYGKLLELILSVPEGKARSDAIQGIAPRLPTHHLEHLFKLALTDHGFVLNDTRAVLRAWTGRVAGDTRSDEEKTLDCDSIVTLLEDIHDLSLRSKLLGYLHLQVRKSKLEVGTRTPFDHALKISDTIGDQEVRLESLRYLATVAGGEEEFAALGSKAGLFKDPAFNARLLAAAAGSADKAGFPELAREWLLEALSLTSQLRDPQIRASIRTNLAQGLARCGLDALAKETFRHALEDCSIITPESIRERMEQRIGKAMSGPGIPQEGKTGTGDVPDLPKDRDHGEQEEGIKGWREKDAEDAVSERKEVIENIPTVSTEQANKNHVLALYDAYEGRLKPVHLRAVARAAPLCMAFDVDLALIGFPTDELHRIVEETITETNIGGGGKYLKELVAQGRVILLPANSKASPEDWRRVGMPVATTSHPDENKRVELEELIKELGSGRGQGRLRSMTTIYENPQRLCLIMGLGKRGLPASLLKSVPYHLELTGKRVSLETCTVMGIIAERLKMVMEK